MIQSIHHIGMGVDDIDASVSVYESAGFKLIHAASYDSVGKCALLESGTGRIELFQFNDEKSKIAQKITKHSAFQTDDWDIEKTD